MPITIFQSNTEFQIKSGIVRKLGELEQVLRRNICSNSQGALSRFSRWRVVYNPEFKRDTSGIVLAATSFHNQETIIYGWFQQLNAAMRLQIIAHEFRHLMPENRSLYSRREELVLPHEKRKIEIDAKIFPECVLSKSR